MKHIILNISQFMARMAMLAVVAILFHACTKDHEPTVVGKWETVEAFGLHWEYEFKSDGQTCRRAPEAFGTTAFCYPYDVDDVTVTVHTNTVETWVWTFVCDDVADVLVTLPDGEKQRFILKRIN